MLASFCGDALSALLDGTDFTLRDGAALLLSASRLALPIGKISTVTADDETVPSSAILCILCEPPWEVAPLLLATITVL